MHKMDDNHNQVGIKFYLYIVKHNSGVLNFTAKLMFFNFDSSKGTTNNHLLAHNSLLQNELLSLAICLFVK